MEALMNRMYIKDILAIAVIFECDATFTILLVASQVLCDRSPRRVHAKIRLTQIMSQLISPVCTIMILLVADNLLAAAYGAACM